MSNKRRRIDAIDVIRISHGLEIYHWRCRRCGETRSGMSSPWEERVNAECSVCGKRVRVVL